MNEKICIILQIIRGYGNYKREWSRLIKEKDGMNLWFLQDKFVFSKLTKCEKDVMCTFFDVRILLGMFKCCIQTPKNVQIYINI